MNKLFFALMLSLVYSQATHAHSGGTAILIIGTPLYVIGALGSTQAENGNKIAGTLHLIPAAITAHTALTREEVGSYFLPIAASFTTLSAANFLVWKPEHTTKTELLLFNAAGMTLSFFMGDILRPLIGKDQSILIMPDFKGGALATGSFSF